LANLNDATYGWRPRSLLLEVHPPQHTVNRAAVISTMTPRALRAFQELFDDAADAVVDRLVAQRDFDAVTDLAQVFPTHVFPRALGSTPTAEQPAAWCGAGSGTAPAWSSGSRRTRRGAGRSTCRSGHQLLEVRDEPAADGGVPVGLLGVVADHEPLRPGAVVAVTVTAGGDGDLLHPQVPATLR